MHPNRFLLLISFLLMYQLSKAATIGNSNPSPNRANNCANFVSTPLDSVNVENFRSNVKQELKRVNCTNPEIIKVSEADLENPKKDRAISSENFCDSVNKIMWKTLDSSLFPNLDHLEKKIFTNHTLCIVVCTSDLNGTLWSYCNAFVEAFAVIEKTSPKVVPKPSTPEQMKNVISQPTNAQKSQKNDSANQPEPVKSVKNSSAEMLKSPTDDLADPANAVKSQQSDQAALAAQDPMVEGNENGKNEEMNEDDLEIEPVEGIPNGAPSKPASTSDMSKKTPQKETVNTSNQSGEHPPPPVKEPSKSLPQTAVVAGTPNLRTENDESHYFIYFVVMSILCIFCYIGIYNKKKILALMIEGRKQKDRRRHASAGYRKLNTNLEEVMPLGSPAPAGDTMIY